MRGRTFLGGLIACVLLVLARSCAMAQAMPVAASVSVIVSDKEGLVSRDIRPEELSILDDRKTVVPAVVIHRAKDLPLRMGVLVDTSSSLGRSRLFPSAIQALKPFLDRVL